ncbi:hypothetical protein ACFV42_49295 [Streptomyces solisilvae]|uniref:hypothetical protein n=2 Tax=Streptomyces TaxID=1883 RepID=UPI00367E8E68
MRERADLDSHITGGGSPGIADDVLPAAPVVLAWYMLDKRHCPMAPELVEAIEKAINEDGLESPTALALIKGYYKSTFRATDPVQHDAYEAFARGWLAGVESEALELESTSGDFEAGHFSYLLGHIAGDLAYNYSWATPYEQDDEADDLTSVEENEERDESDKIEVTHLATDEGDA